jgi:addiction module HigA family antidote
MTLRDPTRRPTHPGEILREDILPALDMTIEELAHRLYLPTATVVDVLNEQAPMTRDLAGRLSRLLNSSPDLWLDLQREVDVWEIRRHPEQYADIEPITREAA